MGLSLERGTEEVPDDGRFHVVMDGAILYSSNSERNALREYREIRDRLGLPKGKAINVRKILEREAAERETRHFLAASSRAKRAKALKRGGKGGSGGVG